MRASAETKPRQRRSVATRRAIYAAAAELFSTVGYHATTVDMIVQRAGVAKGTFFFHFGSKAAVVLDSVREQVAAARVVRERAREAKAGPVAVLRATALALGVHASASHPLTRAVIAAGLESAELGDEIVALLEGLGKELREDARQACAAGLVRAEMEPRALVAALINAYYGAVLRWAMLSRPRSLRTELTALLDRILAVASAQPKGRARAASRARP